MAGKTMIPLLAFAAWSGTGKTTLLKKLIPALCARGIRPGLIKHTHHDMDVDKPGKDSYELRKAGAAQTIVASQQRWALMTETPDEEELDLQFLASRMDTSKLDLINRKQIIHRIVNIRALICRLAIRYPPQTQHRHHMVNS